MDISNSFKGVLICSGLKFEIFPATLAIPKALYPLSEYPMIFFGLAQMKRLELTEIVLVVSRTDRQNIEFLLGNGEILGMKVFYEYQDVRKGFAPLINLLFAKYGNIYVRTVDYMGSFIRKKEFQIMKNVVVKSESIFHKYFPEYIVVSNWKDDLNLDKVIEGLNRKEIYCNEGDEHLLYDANKIMEFIKNDYPKAKLTMNEVFKDTLFFKLYRS